MIQFNWKKMFAVLLILGFGQLSFAGNMYLGPSLFYQSYERSDTNSERTDTYFNIRLGYVGLGGGNLYVGGIYDSETEDYGASEQERTSYGVSFGYFGDSIAVVGSYYISSELSTGGASNYEGTGFKVYLSYFFSLTQSVGLGPMLTYKSFTYTELGGNSLSTDREETKIDPMIAFSVKF